jgi:hypothetical protein
VEQTTLTLDFGTTDILNPVKLSIEIANLENTPGFTAALDLDQFVGSGDTQAFNTPIHLFTNLQATSSKALELTFDSAAQGEFLASYRLLFSDENLPGEATHEMNLLLRGIAIPEPGTASISLAALIFSGWCGNRRARKRCG